MGNEVAKIGFENMSDFVKLGYILSNNDNNIVRDLKRFEDNFEKFLYKDIECNEELEEWEDDFESEESKLFMNFIYWLIGYDNDFEDVFNNWIDVCDMAAEYHGEDKTTQKILFFDSWLTYRNFDVNCGLYLDWKEEPDEAMTQFSILIKRLGYEVSLEGLISEADDLEELFPDVDECLKEQGYTLLSLDTDSDSYSIFMVGVDKVKEVISIGKKIGFHFSRVQ